MCKHITTKRRGPDGRAPDPERARTWLRRVIAATLALNTPPTHLIGPGWLLGGPDQPRSLARPVVLA